MINVVCVKWGTKYPSSYVNTLYNMVQRNLTLPHNFICFTDDGTGLNPGIITKPLSNKLYGWWNKILLFKPGVLTGNNLYLDLDLILVDNINSFAEYGSDEEMSVITDFGKQHETFNSSILKFNSKYHSLVWHTFTNNFKAINKLLASRGEPLLPHKFKISTKKTNKFDGNISGRIFGDQDIITMAIKNQEWVKPYPNEWTWSVKASVNREEQPHTTGIPHEGKIGVCFGTCKPDNTPYAWIKDHWK